jgi:4-amino-4-deoxy-L-arabinose transferase-like glycosyltransferase
MRWLPRADTASSSARTLRSRGPPRFTLDRVVNSSNTLRSISARIASLPSIVLFALFFVAVAISHLTLLRLPYYWDEGGYYIPAALDFYRTGQIIPHYTNAHPPIPNIVLGVLWHMFGYHILATRLCVAGVAAAGLLAVFRLTERLLDAPAALAAALLTAVYPIWFAQSTLAQADIFAAAFTLWGLAVYLPLTAAELRSQARSDTRPLIAIAALFSLAALAKETSIIDPAALAALELYLLFANRREPRQRDQQVRLFAALVFPVLPLTAWFGYHHHVTGFTFGNPEFLRYNATANLTAEHILQGLRYRFIHLVWQRNIWLPILLAAACLFLPRRTDRLIVTGRPLPAPARGAATPKSSELYVVLSAATLRAVAVLILANWIAFSVLGGALLTRYLLPVYPLILLLCINIWRSHVRLWPIFAAVTAAAFISALWLNPPTAFAPEDSLAYRDMILVHQQAIDFVEAHYPHAKVLTAWPVTTYLFLPELGYAAHSMTPVAIEDFTLPSIRKAAQEPGRYDTAIVFTTHFVAPSLRRYLLTHPDSYRARQFAANRDLSPQEIAAILGGRVVWQNSINGEWAAVLRFNRSYEARLMQRPTLLRRLQDDLPLNDGLKH